MTAPAPPSAEAGRAFAAAVESRSDEIATLVTDRQFAADPRLVERYGERGRRKCTEDAKRHISYLAAALSQGSDALFADYVGWAKILLGRLGMSDDDLATNLSLLRSAIAETMPDDVAHAAARVIDEGLRRLPALPASRASFLAAAGVPHEALAREFLRLLLAGDRQGASALILAAVRDGVSVRDVYMHVFQRTQYEIGRLWQVNEISVAQEHFCTAATQMIMSQLYPQIFATARANRSLVAACVGGDLHEIGVRMVADFFEMEGWDTFYLGANTPLPGILQAVAEHQPDVVAISATMSYHVGEVADVIRALRAGTGESPRILVGGYPFGVDPDLWRVVGADGCATDAPGAVAVAARLVAA